MLPRIVALRHHMYPLVRKVGGLCPSIFACSNTETLKAAEDMQMQRHVPGPLLHTEHGPVYNHLIECLLHECLSCLRYSCSLSVPSHLWSHSVSNIQCIRKHCSFQLIITSFTPFLKSDKWNWLLFSHCGFTMKQSCSEFNDKMLLPPSKWSAGSV